MCEEVSDWFTGSGREVYMRFKIATGLALAGVAFSGIAQAETVRPATVSYAPVATTASAGTLRGSSRVGASVKSESALDGGSDLIFLAGGFAAGYFLHDTIHDGKKKSD